MNKYQRGLLFLGGFGIAAFQINWIMEEGLDESRGWSTSLLIAIVLIIVALTPDDVLSSIFSRLTGRNADKGKSAPLELPAAAPASLTARSKPSPPAPKIADPEADKLEGALEDHKMYAEQQGIYDALAGGGRSLSWCCTLSLYASMRLVARTDKLAIHAVVWNSIVRRCTIDMMTEESVGMGDNGYETLEAEAYSDIDTVNRIVDEADSGNRSKIVGFLALGFGCAYNPVGSRSLAAIFDVNVERSRAEIIPHFLRAFS